MRGHSRPEPGVLAVDHLGGSLALILKKHGVITVGSRSHRRSPYACVYLEEAATTYVVAATIGSTPDTRLWGPRRARDVLDDAQ